MDTQPVITSQPPVTSPVAPTPTFTEPKSTSPSKLPLIILIVLTLIFATTSVYFFTKLKKASLSAPSVTISLPSPTPTTSDNPTNSWQTFSHKSGYIVKYPASYKLFAMKMNDIDTTPTDEYLDIMINTETGFNHPHMRITRLQSDLSDTELPVMELAKKYYQANLDMPALPAKSVEKPTVTTFEGFPAVTYSVENKGFKSLLDEYLGYDGTYKVYVLEKNGYKYQIYWTATEELNQIASTFKFTDPSTKYSLEEISQACIDIRNSSKYWISKYKECISPDGTTTTLKDYCTKYGGRFTENGDTCRHALEEGLPCGPSMTSYCSF